MSFPAEHLRLLALRLRLGVGIALSLLLLLMPAAMVARLMEGGTYQEMYDYVPASGHVDPAAFSAA